jgi:hypothetical protein
MKIPKGCIIGGVHPVKPVEEQADIHLDLWQVYEVSSKTWGDKKTRHLVGYNVFDREGRVSTPIKSFNPETRVALTESGRSYLLSSNSGFDRDADYVWGHFCLVNKIKDVEIVTSEYEKS